MAFDPNKRSPEVVLIPRIFDPVRDHTHIPCKDVLFCMASGVEVLDALDPVASPKEMFPPR